MFKRVGFRFLFFLLTVLLICIPNRLQAEEYQSQVLPETDCAEGNLGLPPTGFTVRTNAVLRFSAVSWQGEPNCQFTYQFDVVGANVTNIHGNTIDSGICRIGTDRQKVLCVGMAGDYGNYFSLNIEVTATSEGTVLMQAHESSLGDVSSAGRASRAPVVFAPVIVGSYAVTSSGEDNPQP